MIFILKFDWTGVKKFKGPFWGFHLYFDDKISNFDRIVLGLQIQTPFNWSYIFYLFDFKLTEIWTTKPIKGGLLWLKVDVIMILIKLKFNILFFCKLFEYLLSGS